MTDDSSPFRDQLLRRLEDRAWHTEGALAHPTLGADVVAAFVRVLRAEGYVIEEREEQGTRSYRFVSRLGPLSRRWRDAT